MTDKEFEHFSKFTTKELNSKVYKGLKIGNYFYWVKKWRQIINIDKTIGIIHCICIDNPSRIDMFYIGTKGEKESILKNFSLKFFWEDFNSKKKQIVYSRIPSERYKKYVVDAFLSIYPDGDVVEDGDYLQLTTYFPEIRITNSTEQAHLMTDVFIRYSFDTCIKCLINVAFARTSATDAELSSYYLFSHLSGGILGKWHSDFCYGNDTPLANLTKQMESGASSSFVEYFLLFREYLNWESLEGRPYRYIGNIKKSNIKEHFMYEYIYEGRLPEFYRSILDTIPNLNYAVENVTRNKLKLKLTKQSVNLLDEKLSSVDSSLNFIRSNGVSGTSRANDFLISNNVVYKGETIVPKVISTEETSTPKIHLTILNRIVNELEELASNNLSTLKFENYVNNRQINNQ